MRGARVLVSELTLVLAVRLRARCPVLRLRARGGAATLWSLGVGGQAMGPGYGAQLATGPHGCARTKPEC
eukprot:1810725-Prymnesium_polylepis.1